MQVTAAASPLRIRENLRRAGVTIPLLAPRRACFLTIAVFLGACAATGGRQAISDRGTITREELSSILAGNLYDAVERLRPLWLYRNTPRSVNIPTEVAVVQDGQYFGGLESLRSISPAGVWSIEFLDGPAATAAIPRLSTGRHVESAIVIRFSR